MPDARDLGDGRHLLEHRPGGGPHLARQRARAAPPRCRWRWPRPRRRRWRDGRRPASRPGSNVSYGLASTPEGSVSASPIRRSPRSTPRTRDRSPAGGLHGGTDRAAQQGERVVDRVDVLPTALHHVGVLGGATAQRLRRVAREVGRRRAGSTRSLLTATASPALPSLTPTSATTPEPSASRVAMASVRRSSGVSPSRRRTTTPSVAAAASVPASALASRVRAAATSSSRSLTCAEQAVDPRRAARPRHLQRVGEAAQLRPPPRGCARARPHR